MANGAYERTAREEVDDALGVAIGGDVVEQGQLDAAQLGDGGDFFHTKQLFSQFPAAKIAHNCRKARPHRL